MNIANSNPDEVHMDDQTSDELSKGDLKNPEHNDEEVKPRFIISKLKKMRDKLRGALDDRWINKIVPPSVIEEQILPACQACLPANLNRGNLLDTLLLHLNGVKINKVNWDRVATRVAGNIKHIRAEPLKSICRIPRGGWALLETAEAEFSKSKKGTMGAIFKYRVITGKAAASYFSRFMSLRFLPKYGKDLGIGKPRWWKQPRIYVGTKLVVFLLPAENAEQLEFKLFYATSKCIEVNKYYAAGRTNPCIKGEKYKCWHCPRGLLEENADIQCEFATHRQAWVKRKCIRCKREQWFYSHWSDQSACLYCREVVTRGR